MDYEVNSVAEYIGLIKELQEKSKYPLYYRGQSKKYDRLDATAFRMNLQSKGFLRHGYPFKDIIEDFKYEVWNEIDIDTRKRFLAFCQHHGIPTNLLDFTENPLIALYFAVSHEKYITEPGYIHIINRPVLDMTDIIEEYSILGKSIFELTFSDDIDLLKKVLNKFNTFEIKYPNLFYTKFKQLNEDIKHFNKLENREYIYDDTEIATIDDKIFDEVDNINKENKHHIDIPVYENILLTETEKFIFEELYYKSDFQSNVVAYLFYLRYFRKLLNIEHKWPEYINGLLPMMYKPILNFKRGINQKGIFIYQDYYEQNPLSFEGYVDYTVQKIETDYIIKVTDSKYEIKTTLDLLNINKKFAYGDFESIADYIFSKYRKF